MKKKRGLKLRCSTEVCQGFAEKTVCFLSKQSQLLGMEQHLLNQHHGIKGNDFLPWLSKYRLCFKSSQHVALGIIVSRTMLVEDLELFSFF